MLAVAEAVNTHLDLSRLLEAVAADLEARIRRLGIDKYVFPQGCGPAEIGSYSVAAVPV